MPSDRGFLVRRSQAHLVLDALDWSRERREDAAGFSVLQADSDDEADILRQRLLQLIGKGFEHPQSAWDLDLRMFAAPTPIPQPERNAVPVHGRHAKERRESSQIGPTIGVLDTGICPHKFCVGCFFAPASSIYDDESQVWRDDGPVNEASSHATFITGIIAQQAPNARVIVLKVLDDESASTNVIGLAEGVVQLRQMGAQVVNLSLVTTGPADVDYAFPIEVALEQLGPDIPVIAAAGNQSRSKRVWPAGLDNVLAVGAAEPRPEKGGWQRTEFSNFGPWVNLWAPGREVISTYIDFPNDKGRNRDRSWAKWDGTSFSAAIVTGRVAALMESDGSTAWEAVNRILVEAPARVDLRDDDAPPGPLVEPNPRSGLDYLGR